MRITENKLRSLIKETMSEMSHELNYMPSVQHGRDLDQMLMQKAQKCISMAHGDMAKLSEMCEQICAVSERSLMAKCIELCICACKCDIEGCCSCLSVICQDPRCAQICSDCCSC